MLYARDSSRTELPSQNVRVMWIESNYKYNTTVLFIKVHSELMSDEGIINSD